MHKIGDMTKLHIDSASDLGSRGSLEGWGYPKLGGRIEAGGRSSLHTMVPIERRQNVPIDL